MRRRVIKLYFCFCIIFAGVTLAYAGGALEQINITGNVPSAIPGEITAPLVGIRWDIRSIPVQYSMNTTLDPVPNPLGSAFLSVATAQAALQQSFDAWNEIPTSYIDMRITGTTTNPGLRGFDFKNELTFRTVDNAPFAASSPSISLIADSVFIDGDDIDGDGDSDVSRAISVATDVDGDGDIEFPAGFYKAGTILDNDVQFNTKSNGFRYTVDPAAVDTVFRSADLIGVATHEFGHSHGLSHSAISQISGANGDGATMFPFPNFSDPAEELQLRTLENDDIAYSSFFYPEGTAGTGLAALQPGDIAFSKRFGVITGNIRHGVLNQNIAGAHVFAVDKETDSVISGAYSGTTQLSFDPVTGGLSFLSPDFGGILDGKYTIPVPAGQYFVGVEAVDGFPVPASSINSTCRIGVLSGQQNFNEQFYDHQEGESNSQGRPQTPTLIDVRAGQVDSGRDIVTLSEIKINNFGPTLNNLLSIFAPAGTYYAVRITAAQVQAINPGGDLLIRAAAFFTVNVDSSVPVVFSEVMLTTGVANPDGTATINLAEPLESALNFVAQDYDFAPFFFKNPDLLGKKVREGMASGQIGDLFLVLRIPTTTPFLGVSNLPPLIGFNTGTQGFSYISKDNGATFLRETTRNYMFSLIITQQ
jgi:hypothetical protein